MTFLTIECGNEHRHDKCSKPKECECTCHQGSDHIPADQGLRGWGSRINNMDFDKYSNRIEVFRYHNIDKKIF